MAIQKKEFFEHTATLQFMKQIGEAFIELIDFDGIKDVSHLCVTGNLIDANIRAEAITESGRDGIKVRTGVSKVSGEKRMVAFNHHRRVAKPLQRQSQSQGPLVFRCVDGASQRTRLMAASAVLTWLDRPRVV